MSKKTSSKQTSWSLEQLNAIPSGQYPNSLYIRDLNAAASLVTSGFDLTKVDKTNATKVLFVFDKTEGIENTLESYWSNKLTIQARSLLDNLKMLKNRIYSD